MAACMRTGVKHRKENALLGVKLGHNNIWKERHVKPDLLLVVALKICLPKTRENGTIMVIKSLMVSKSVQGGWQLHLLNHLAQDVQQNRHDGSFCGAKADNASP